MLLDNPNFVMLQIFQQVVVRKIQQVSCAPANPLIVSPFVHTRLSRCLLFQKKSMYSSVCTRSTATTEFVSNLFLYGQATGRLFIQVQYKHSIQVHVVLEKIEKWLYANGTELVQVLEYIHYLSLPGQIHFCRPNAISRSTVL